MDYQPATGGVQSPYDNRDQKIGMAGIPVALPAVYENQRPHQLARMNQRKIGACVGHGLAKAAREYWYRKTGEIINFSPRFLYAIAKCQDGLEGEGTYQRLVASILTKYGCATEKTCPNDTTLGHEEYVYYRDITRIPAEAFQEALKYKVAGYAFVPIDQYSLKKAIQDYGIVSMLLQVGSEWWLPTWNKNDILPLRAPQKIVSGHEVELTGWDNDLFTVDNHWSEIWADLGFNKLSWATYSKFLTEAVVLLDTTPPPAPAYIFTQDIKFGETSDAVRQLQKRLISLGYSIPAGATSYFGEQTRQAVIKFQNDHAIYLTWLQRNFQSQCIVGPRTREALNRK